MTMNEYVVVGCRNFGREIICWTEDLIAHGHPGRIVGFVDDDRNALVGYDYDVEWLGSLVDYQPSAAHSLIVGIADPAFKEKTVMMLDAKGAHFASLIHPTAVIAKTVKLARGVVFCPYAVASADAHVEEFVTVNCHSGIGHDAHVGAFSTLSSYIDLTGRTSVGKRVLVGSGARLLPGVTVGDDAVIGAGSTVVRDVPAGATVYSQPARRL
jgi:sugar O-acyltransferase (sialic acid O-acetyltransferase NeuD family)